MPSPPCSRPANGGTDRVRKCRPPVHGGTTGGAWPTLVAFLALALAAAAPAEDLAAALARLGTWDGRTASAELAGPYEDPRQQAVPFGRRSYWLAPWRAYLDTWPGSKYATGLGIYFSVRRDDELEPTAQVLAEAGIRVARVEVGWGSFDYADPTRLNGAPRLARKLKALAKVGIRPLILLNANSGAPVPLRGLRVKLLAAAEVGAREITVDKTGEIVLGRTGLRGQDYPVAFPLITAVDAATGRCTLSAPLKKAVPAGNLDLTTLKYEPFGGATCADGTPNKALDETVAGWMTYVAALTRFVRETLANGNPRDAGFDLEVWNELTFGSHFLEDKHYYNPPRKWRDPWTYTRGGRTIKGFTSLLAMTADWVAEPANGLPGVRVITGFSNQWPWDSGTEMWPTQTGFSRHYYTGLEPFDPADPKLGTLCAETLAERDRKSGPLNALGLPDGTPDGKDWHTVLPGTFPVPTHRRSFPEQWLYAYQTEFLARDIQPFPGPWSQHHRYGHPGHGRSAEVWETEFNTWRQPWIDSLVKQGVDRAESKLRTLAHAIGAKALARAYLIYPHKGLHTLMPYATQETDSSFSVLPEAFFRALAAAKYELTPEVRAELGPQLTVIGRMHRLLAKGEALGECRPLRVAKLVEHQPRLVFAGDGTPAHPDRFHRDDFAVLPFQLAADRFAVGYYVVTRDLVHERDQTKDRLDPARYAMPDQTFDLTLANVRGAGLRAECYDPWTDRATPAPVLAAGPDSVTVRLAATDAPRFVLLRETQPGPLVRAPSVTRSAEGLRLAFTPATSGQAEVTWGLFPYRRAVGLRAEYCADAELATPVLARREAQPDFNWRDAAPVPQVGATAFSLRLTGTLTPTTTGGHTFRLEADGGARLYLGDKLAIDRWRGAGPDKATVELTAGQGVALRLEYRKTGRHARLRLLQRVGDQPEQLVPAEALTPGDATPGSDRRVLAVTAGQPVTLDLPARDPRDAVRVTLTRDGLTAPWPRWDWDVAGATYP